jgi:hypothetical protein
MTSFRRCQRFTPKATLSSTARTPYFSTDVSPKAIHESRGRFPRTNNDNIVIFSLSSNVFDHRSSARTILSICFANVFFNRFPSDSFRPRVRYDHYFFAIVRSLRVPGTRTLLCSSSFARAYRMIAANQLRLFGCPLRVYRVFAKIERAYFNQTGNTAASPYTYPVPRLCSTRPCAR